MLPDSHWQRLASMAPDEVCRRTGADYDAQAGSYLVPLLNRRVVVNPAERGVEWGDGAVGAGRGPGFVVGLVALVYLVEAEEVRLSGEWVTGEMLPAGAFFFRGQHAIPTEGVAERYGADPEGLLAAGARLGGKVVDVGDACVELAALPRVPVRVVLWVGDDEFPSRVTVLFDRRAGDQLRLDALLSLAQYTVSALVEEGEPAA